MRGSKTGESQWRLLPEQTGGRRRSGQDAGERPFIGVLAWDKVGLHGGVSSRRDKGVCRGMHTQEFCSRCERWRYYARARG
jgi:hypothetical protein